MRKTLALYLALIGCATVSVCADGIRPADLRCEYLQDPLGVDATQPRLSWITEAKARGWNSRGQQSGWSDPAVCSVGPLNPQDWTAKWMTMKVDQGLPHPWFRRVFEVKTNVKRAEVYVNTPAHYELYINGQKVYPHNGKWVVDFGTTLTGWRRLRMTGLKPGQAITIDYSDLHEPALAFNKNQDGFQTLNQQEIYVAGSESEGVWNA